MLFPPEKSGEFLPRTCLIMPIRPVPYLHPQSAHLAATSEYAERVGQQHYFEPNPHSLAGALTKALSLGDTSNKNLLESAAKTAFDEGLPRLAERLVLAIQL